MADEEVTLETVYAEVDKRVKAAIDALEAKLIKELDARVPAKKKFRLVNRAAGSAS